MAEFMNTITMSAVVVTLFLGGPDGPTPHVPILRWLVPDPVVPGQDLVFLFIYVWLRAALPRLRYDQLMDLGWKVLIPLSLGWVLILAGIIVGRWWGSASSWRWHRRGPALGLSASGRRAAAARGRSRRRRSSARAPRRPTVRLRSVAPRDR